MIEYLFLSGAVSHRWKIDDLLNSLFISCHHATHSDGLHIRRGEAQFRFSIQCFWVASVLASSKKLARWWNINLISRARSLFLFSVRNPARSSSEWECLKYLNWPQHMFRGQPMTRDGTQTYIIINITSLMFVCVCVCYDTLLIVPFKHLTMLLKRCERIS